jgi:Zn-dependent protease
MAGTADMYKGYIGVKVKKKEREKERVYIFGLPTWLYIIWPLIVVFTAYTWYKFVETQYIPTLLGVYAAYIIGKRLHYKFFK